MKKKMFSNISLEEDYNDSDGENEWRKIYTALGEEMEQSYYLGKSYYYGDKYYKINYNDAIRYFKIAADLGHIDSQYHVGKLYFAGFSCETDDTETNDTKVIKYFKLAADQGHTLSQFQLGGLYYLGIRCEKNTTEGYKYYKLAADQGNISAQYFIGCWYYDSVECEQNLIEAFKYFKLAADQGDKYSKAKFYFLNRFTLDPHNKQEIIEKAIQEKSICPITQNILTDVNNIVVTNCKHCFELEGMFLYYHSKKNHAGDNIICPLCKAKL